MSGKHKGLQRLIRHDSPHSLYLNCHNHDLTLCLVHLLKYYTKLSKLDGLLISLWKTFKFSSIKQAIFENAQVEHDLKPMKIIRAAVLAPINILSKFLETSMLFYCSITEKINHLLEQLQDIKAELKDHDNMETSLKFFFKAVSFLNISAERNQLGRNLRAWSKRSCQHFLKFHSIDLIEEIKEQMLDDNPVLPAFNVFMPSNSSSLLDWNE